MQTDRPQLSEVCTLVSAVQKAVNISADNPLHDPDKIKTRTTARNQRRPSSNMKVKCIKLDKGNRRQNALMGAERGCGGGVRRLYLDFYRLMAPTLLQCSGATQMTHLDRFDCNNLHGRGGEFPSAEIRW